MNTPPTRPPVTSNTMFQPLTLASIRLPNRLVRAATYEGMATRGGKPRPELGQLYASLSRGGIGTLITGFTFISPDGRAMQTGQAGIEQDDRIGQWETVLETARRAGGNTRYFMQIAHTGRQTRQAITGLPVVGASARRCTYFRQPVTPLDEKGVNRIIELFGQAAWRAREAGFDGIEVHAAHGYLIHQFLSPWTNLRTDVWKDRPRFLEAVLASVREQAGNRFPVFVKLSATDDNTPGIRLEDTIETVRRISTAGVDAVEISYGTMEYALNIIRGACPVHAVLKINPIFRDMPPILRWAWKHFMMKSYLAKFVPFKENYNLAAAAAIRQTTGVPVIQVGGVRSGAGIRQCLEAGIDAVSLCRPLILDPDFPRHLATQPDAVSTCTNCNQCTIHCDTDQPLQCYRNQEPPHEPA